jgi:hypothetical protein
MCSSAVRGAGAPKPTCHHRRRQGRTISVLGGYFHWLLSKEYAFRANRHASSRRRGTPSMRRLNRNLCIPTYDRLNTMVHVQLRAAELRTVDTLLSFTSDATSGEFDASPAIGCAERRRPRAKPSSFDKRFLSAGAAVLVQLESVSPAGHSRNCVPLASTGFNRTGV